MVYALCDASCRHRLGELIKSMVVWWGDGSGKDITNYNIGIIFLRTENENT